MRVAQLLRKYCAFPFSLPNGQARMSARKLQLVKDYVDAGLSSRLTLEDIAASIHMSAGRAPKKSSRSVDPAVSHSTYG